MRGAHRLERRGRRADKRVEPAERIDHTEMRRRVEQRLVLVLAVQFDEAIGQVLQRAGRRERAVDERAAAPLRRDLAADEQFLAVAFEDRFDRRGVLAGAHEVSRRPPAEEQADGLDEDRLPGPGFAREHVQAGVEFDLDRVNHREVLNAQEAEHGKMARTPIVT